MNVHVPPHSIRTVVVELMQYENGQVVLVDDPWTGQRLTPVKGIARLQG
ncbi:hypothetical protein SBA2_840005 [Acidobacteriia bacterium SbA2]|nr:hypothetical protein SBA2_840005 [Acidobacteriia bacterium SbA2]